MPTPLPLDDWDDTLVGGRVLRRAGGWHDTASATRVRCRAWLLDAAAADRWTGCHKDALDAWVLARGAGWVGLRLDGLVPAPSSMPGVPVPAAWSPSGVPLMVPWPHAARLLRRAGIVPIGVAAMRWLSERPASWWGAIGIPARRASLAPADDRALAAFERQGGHATLLLDAAPERGMRTLEAQPMRDTDLLDMLERMDLEPDPVRALHALCTDLSRRVGAIGAGVATDGDGVVARTGAAEIPPAAWLRAVATGVGATRLVTVSAQMEAIAVTDVAGSLGALWVAWPAGAARPDEASDVLVACARLAAGRLAQRRALATAPERADGPLLVGDSAPMAAVRARLARAARSPFPVLIVGESGVGKELAARGVHAGGARRHRRFVAVNAAALPDDLLEAELFGHARGAFTGAIGERAGVFEEADGGTLFLDEVGELSLRAQAKLLRVLQEGEVRRLGEAGTRRVDVRLIAATNVALDEAVQAGRFRADLFYRLAVLCVRIPPLRERRGDVAALVARLWTVCARRVGTEARLHPHIVERLQAHDWPGNVRELENVLAMLAVDAPRRGVVLPELLGDFPSGLRLGSEAGTGGSSGDVRLSLDAARRAFDAALVQEALSRTGGRRGEAARRLGLSRQGLSKLVRRLGLDGADVRPS